ncbi:helix-turn-helix transcriptional regulator [Streptomyces sp. J2-1]|nr:helix-turn-helix transcriptional regulator [Streptomyces corallincola]
MDLPELGAFLKTRRRRIPPGEVGIVPGPRRRVAGLRRAEVAQLAGVSLAYYTELEQARGAQPSAQMLSALARTLRLDVEEQTYLFHVAGRVLPAPEQERLRPQRALVVLMELLGAVPAMIMTDLYVPLLQNEVGRALFQAPLPTKGMEASMIYRWFAEPELRLVHPAEDHAFISGVLVADLRACAARRGGDEETRLMISRLRQNSEEFDRVWAQGEVTVDQRERRRFLHPALGTVEVDLLNVCSEDGRQRLVWVSTPSGSPAELQLASLCQP